MIPELTTTKFGIQETRIITLSYGVGDDDGGGVGGCEDDIRNNCGRDESTETKSKFI